MKDSNPFLPLRYYSKHIARRFVRTLPRGRSSTGRLTVSAGLKVLHKVEPWQIHAEIYA